MTAKIVELGTLYMGGQPVEPGALYNGKGLSFGDTLPVRELQWVDDGGMLVANRCVCTNISWVQLNQMGFVLGTPVWIGGRTYICRCLKVGNEKGAPNEWDTLLNKYGDDDRLWHWDKCYFWGQEAPKNHPDYRVIRAYYPAQLWHFQSGIPQDKCIGFRPVLEPLVSDLSEIAVGSNIKAFGPTAEPVEGRLVDFDDYDLVMASKDGVNFDWTTRKGNYLIVDRKALIGVGKANS